MKIKDLLKKETYLRITLKYVLFVNILVWLSISIWHNFIFIFNFKDLHGLDKNEEPVSFNFRNWVSADYQLSVEKYLINHNPMSPFFIRLNNQIGYSLFDHLQVSEGVIGKDFYLFDTRYVDTYYGRDYIGEDSLRIYVEKMKFVQDTLEKLNKEFIYVQAPGKASFYPEFLPETNSLRDPERTNYFQLNKLLLAYKINYVDFVPYFLAAKDTSKYPMFTDTGIHWSKYASVYVMDSLNHFIESTRNIDLPDMYIKDVDEGYARFDDADLESVANLLFTISDVRYGYPNYDFEPRDNKKTPFVTLVSDSYLGGLYWGNWFLSFSKESQFWFYNTSMFSMVDSDKIHKYQLDQNAVINKSDIVIVSSNEPNIKGTSWGFIDEMYDYYKYGKRVVNNKERIEFLRTVDSCKATLTDKDIERAKPYMESQHVSLDSAKKILCIWKMNKSIF